MGTVTMAHYTKHEVAYLIKSFLDGTCGEWEWDDFTSVKQKEPELEKVRIRLIKIHDEYPSQNPNEYCDDNGVKEMLEIIETLEKLE